MRLMASYDSRSMKPALFAFVTLLGSQFCPTNLRAQAPAAPALSKQNPTAPTGPVPISEEPHHRLVLQNDFTRVYNVMVPALDTTLLHQHDVPYIYVTLGAADIINAIVGKPELHQTLQDGETHYSGGHFAHVARTDSGTPFRNVTIELLRPQGATKNLCKEVVPGGALNCVEEKKDTEPTAEEKPAAGRKNLKGKSKTKNPPAEKPAQPSAVPYFETDEIRIDLYKVSSGNDYVDAASKTDQLLVALNEANLDVNLGGEHIQFLHGGDVLWLPAGQHRRLVDFLGTQSAFLLISFKDSSPAPKTQ